MDALLRRRPWLRADGLRAGLRDWTCRLGKEPRVRGNAQQQQREHGPSREVRRGAMLPPGKIRPFN